MPPVAPLFAASLCAAALLLAAPLHAQTPGASPTPSSTTVAGPVRAWRATLPGGSFVVPVNAMVSVSMHEYVVDGAARVTEVNIDTTGNALARFYHLEPLTPQTPLAVGQSLLNKAQELTSEAVSRSGQDELWRKVVKSYPNSTHAHTIEFRVGSREDLQKVFKSADEAMRFARDTVFKL